MKSSDDVQYIKALFWLTKVISTNLIIVSQEKTTL